MKPSSVQFNMNLNPEKATPREFVQITIGGLSGKKAFSLKKLDIKGDFMLAQVFEHRFLETQVPARTADFLKSPPALAQKAKL